MRRLALLAAMSCVGIWVTSVSVHATPRTCDVISDDVIATRKVGDLDKLARLWAEARGPASSCTEHTLYCLGQSIALAPLEAGYRQGDAAEAPETIEQTLSGGLVYGSPWQLRAGLGDIRLSRARKSHSPALYSEAALDHQEALIAIGEPTVCGAYGEAPRPEKTDIAAIYSRLSTALLLANPVKVATTKCAPCQWMFIAGIAGFSPSSRPLPITFAEGATAPTPEGLTAIAALVDCLRAGGYTRIVLSGHTDQIGSGTYNLALSHDRLEVVRKLLVEGGYGGQIALEPKGKDEPFVAEGDGYSPAEIRRLNRRIEFRGGEAADESSCH